MLILANWPYTLLGIIPTNNRLKAIASDAAGSASRRLMETWGRLHAVRTTLGIGAALAYLWALN
jgi:Anthrone oxygenase